MSTAAIVTGSLVGDYDPNITDGGPQQIIASAKNYELAGEQRLVNGYTFKVEANTSSNNDPVTVLDLVAQGVSFANADGLRNITTKAWFRNVAGTTFGYSEHVATVKGSAAGTTPVLSIAGEATINQAYRVRHMLTTTGTTPVYVTAAVAISSSAVVVRCTGGVAGQDLRWLVEVEVGPLRIVPVGVT